MPEPPSDGPILGEPPINIRSAHDSGPTPKRITRIVIHDEEFAVFPGSALSIARYFGNQSTQASCHYVMDPAGEEHCVPENVIAWHAPPNGNARDPGGGSIGFEHNGYSHYTRDQWMQPGELATLHWSARRTADVALRHGIPVVHITDVDLRNSGGNALGFCGHRDVSLWAHQSDHTDPGDNFPWDLYLWAVALRQNTPHGWTTHPTYDPPITLPPIASVATTPAGGILFGADGSVYVWGSAYHGGANGQSYWGNRRVSEGRCDTRYPQLPYTIRALSGEWYDYGYAPGQTPLRWSGVASPANTVLDPIRCATNIAGGLILVGNDGGVYCWGTPFWGTPRGQSYWSGRTPAEVRVAIQYPNHPYTLKSAEESRYYDFGYMPGQVPVKW